MRTQALEQAIDAVVAVNARNQVTLFNAAAEALWGLERTAVLGQCASMLALGDLRAAEDRNGHNLAIARADGTVRHARLHTTAFGTDSASSADGPAQQFAAFLHEDGAAGSEQGAALSPAGLRMLSLCLDHAENPVMITDAHGAICHLNGGFTRLLGYARHQAVGRRWQDLLMPINVRPEQIPSLLAPLAAGQPLYNEALVADKRGQPRWLSVAVSPIIATADAGGWINTVWVLTDITATKVRESIQHRTLEALARDVPTAQIMSDLCRRVERMAPGTKAAVTRAVDGHLRLVAMPSGTAGLAASFDRLQIGLQAGSCAAAAFLGHAVAVRDIAQDPRCEQLRDHALSAGVAATWSTPVRAADGHVLGTFALCFSEPRLPDALHENLVSVAADLCALALVRDQTQERIHRLAYYDALTGLPNRQLLLSRADDAVAHAHAHGAPLALLFINLNNFKHVNDAQGHGAGDRLLIEVASRLQQATAERAQDATVGRLSGDEFAVLLPGHGRDEATATADALLRALESPIAVAHGLSLSPSASIGISLLTEQAGGRETLLHHADLAVSQARKRGGGTEPGNRVCLYDAVLARRLGDRRMLECDLREAVGSGQLQMRYQPQIHLASGNLWAVEALARWPHPRRGDIAPSVFVPLAEESGLIVALGYWAVREACAQQARWRRLGAAVPAISVNLSPLSMRDPALPDVVAQALRTHALPAGELTIEITESVFLDHTPEAEATIAALRKLGVRLSIDDFGTGFSSLSRLMRLPVDEIKLDRSFLVDLETSEATRTLVEAVIRIGRARNLNVVAEGVTNALQRQFLLDQGCNVGQGFLFAQPLPAASIDGWQPQPSWPGLTH